MTPGHGVFLVGTDTGVGKTAVGTAVLTLARRRGLYPIPFKPAETGCTPLPADALRLRAAAARDDIPLEVVCPFAFSSPVAPALAAAQSNVHLTIATLLSRLPTVAGDFLLVEAAGGLLTPYAPEVTAADLGAALRLPLLLVARNALGTINHTALALSEIRRRALPLAGFILVDTTADHTPDRPHNAELIATATGTLPLASLPYVPGADPDALADQLGAQIPPDQLFARFRLPPNAP